MPPPMPVTIPISAAGTETEPGVERLERAGDAEQPSPAASKTLTTRSSRPSAGWKAKVTSPATTGTIR